MKRKHQLAVVLGPVIAVIVAGVVLHVNNNRLRTGAETVLSAGEPGDRPAQGTDVYTDATASRASGDPNGTGRTSSHPSVKPVDAAARHDNGTAEKEDPTVLDDLPLPDFGDTTNEELQDAVQRTLESVRNAKSLQDGAQYLEAFLRKYPLGSSTAVMMNQLAGIYRDLRRFDDAKRILQHAKVLVGNDRFANTLELTEASIDFAKRDFVRMECGFNWSWASPYPSQWTIPMPSRLSASKHLRCWPRCTLPKATRVGRIRSSRKPQSGGWNWSERIPRWTGFLLMWPSFTGTGSWRPSQPNPPTKPPRTCWRRKRKNACLPIKVRGPTAK